MVVPANAEHPCTAFTFINYMLDAENGATLTNCNYYGTPNEAATEFVDPEVIEFYAATDEAEGLEVIEDTGDYEINFTDYFANGEGLRTRFSSRRIRPVVGRIPTPRMSACASEVWLGTGLLWCRRATLLPPPVDDQTDQGRHPEHQEQHRQGEEGEVDAPLRHILKTVDQVAQRVPRHFDRRPGVFDDRHHCRGRSEVDRQRRQIDDVVEIVELSLELLDLAPNARDLVEDTEQLVRVGLGLLSHLGQEGDEARLRGPRGW